MDNSTNEPTLDNNDGQGTSGGNKRRTLIKKNINLTNNRKEKIIQFFEQNSTNHQMFQSQDWKHILVRVMKDSRIELSTLSEWIERNAWIQERANAIADGVIYDPTSREEFPPAKRQRRAVEVDEVDSGLQEVNIPSSSTTTPPLDQYSASLLPTPTTSPSHAVPMDAYGDSLLPTPIISPEDWPSSTVPATPTTSHSPPPQLLVNEDNAPQLSTSQTVQLEGSYPCLPTLASISVTQMVQHCLQQHQISMENVRIPDSVREIDVGLHCLEMVLQTARRFRSLRTCIPLLESVYRAFEMVKYDEVLEFVKWTIRQNQTQVGEPQVVDLTVPKADDGEGDA